MSSEENEKLSLDEILSRILYTRLDLTRGEVEGMMREKIEDVGGFLTKEAAAYMIGMDLGVDLKGEVEREERPEVPWYFRVLFKELREFKREVREEIALVHKDLTSTITELAGVPRPAPVITPRPAPVTPPIVTPVPPGVLLLGEVERLVFKDYKTKEPVGAGQAGWNFIDFPGFEALAERLKVTGTKWVAIGSCEYRLSGSNLRLVQRRPIKR